MSTALKLIAKILLGATGLAALVVGSASAYVFGFKPTTHPAPDLVAPHTPESIERGRYLAVNVFQCAWCHSTIDRDAPGAPLVKGQELAGRDWTYEIQAEMGIYKNSFKIYASNISPHPKAGIGAYTDGELVRAIREGIKRDGTGIFDFMPYALFRETMTDADAIAIVSYLRAAPAQPKPMQPCRIPLIGAIPGRRFAPAPVTTPAPPVPTTPKERGQYLLKAALCHFCHDLHTDDGVKELAGGAMLKVPSGELRTPNISSHPALGIGTYSEDELVRVLTDGVNKAGKPLRGMPWSNYVGLTNEDKHAIAIALKASPPVQ